MSDFKKLGLSQQILSAIESIGYKTPTPIQKNAIPHLLEGKDLLGIAQTGTGKTAAFGLPLIQKLSSQDTGASKLGRKQVRSLILAPTRELASQIHDNLNEFSGSINLKSHVVFGGVGKSPQIRAIMRGLDILVATPGRLIDLASEGHINFSQVETFILDEADRMLDMGFIRDIRKIISKLPSQKQTLLFSATMPRDIATLAHSLLKNPVRVEVTPESSTVDKIKQSVLMVEKSNKNLLLQSILEDQDIESVLVFTRTKHGANRVVKFLDKHSIPSAAIHGNKSQGARVRALSDFKNAKIRVLVATDIAARGIDIPQVSHVINFEVPNYAENYVHRIGRTGRAGRDGIAIMLCEPEERKYLKQIEKFIRLKIPQNDQHPYFGVEGKPRVLQQPRGDQSKRWEKSTKSSNSRSRNSNNSNRPNKSKNSTYKKKENK